MNRNYVHENFAIILQRFSMVWLKIALNLDIILHWCAKAILHKFWTKSWFLCISLFSALLLFQAISLFRPFKLNFEKQLQEMNESRVKPIRDAHYTIALTYLLPWRDPCLSFYITGPILITSHYTLIDKSKGFLPQKF